MAANAGAPIIIKRKKIIAAGHHGGAWKVAYADFVTAMMAFFLLMWLLGATNEKQRIIRGRRDFFPVEIWFWVSTRLLLIVRKFCSATIALVFVRILAIWASPNERWVSTDLLKRPLNARSHSDLCACRHRYTHFQF